MPRAKLAGGIGGKASRLARLGSTLAQNAESDEAPVTTPVEAHYQEPEIHEETLAQEENSIIEQEVMEATTSTVDTEDAEELLHDTNLEEPEESQEEEYDESEYEEEVDSEESDQETVEDEAEEEEAEEVATSYGYYQEETEEADSDYMPASAEATIDEEPDENINEDQPSDTAEPEKPAKATVTLDALAQVKLTIALINILGSLESADLEGINILLGNPTSTELAETVAAIVSDPAGTETLLETVAPLAEIDRTDVVLAAVKYYALLINEYDESTQQNLATILLDEAPEDASLALESLAVALAKAPASIFDVATQIIGALQSI
jgi:hypothetical protein